MFESFLFYILSVYFVYHVLSRSEILDRPRNYFLKSFPWWVTKPLTCAFCMAFWSGILMGVGILLTSGVIVVSTINLMAAPVAVFVLDLVVQKLLPVPGSKNIVTKD